MINLRVGVLISSSNVNIGSGFSCSCICEYLHLRRTFRRNMLSGSACANVNQTSLNGPKLNLLFALHSYFHSSDCKLRTIAGAMAKLTDLAVETRFQIFDQPSYFPATAQARAAQEGRAPGANGLFRQPRSKRLFNKVNATAVLFVNRKMHQEALTVFYKLNTIRIHHYDICGWTLDYEPISCDRDLLERAILDDTSIWTPFSGCGACGDDLYGVIETSL